MDKGNVLPNRLSRKFPEKNASVVPNFRDGYACAMDAPHSLPILELSYENIAREIAANDERETRTFYSPRPISRCSIV